MRLEIENFIERNNFENYTQIPKFLLTKKSEIKNYYAYLKKKG